MQRLVVASLCMLALMFAAGVLDSLAKFEFKADEPISLAEAERATEIQLLEDSQILIHAYLAADRFHRLLIQVPRRLNILGEPAGSIDARGVVESIRVYDKRLQIDPIPGHPCLYYEPHRANRSLLRVYQIEAIQGNMLILEYIDI